MLLCIEGKKCPRIIGCENFQKDWYYILCYAIDLSERICLHLCIQVNDQGDDQYLGILWMTYRQKNMFEWFTMVGLLSLIWKKRISSNLGPLSVCLCYSSGFGMNSFMNVKATFVKLPKSILWSNWESTFLNQVSCPFWRCGGCLYGIHVH